MSNLQELSHREITQVILSAAERRLPLSITVRAGERWATYQSRLFGMKDQDLLLAAPLDDQGEARMFPSGESLGVSLKLKHHKYLFLARVASAPPAEALGQPLLVLDRPTRMQRLQRRSYIRAAVPSGCVARAAFWIGGHRDEPTGIGPDRPVWSGRVTDLSAGGFSARTTEESVHLLETGDRVGTRLVFGAGQEAVYVDACVRHVSLDEGGTILGFQFLGLEYADEGKAALQAISRRVDEFHAAAPHEPVRAPQAPNLESTASDQ